MDDDSLLTPATDRPRRRSRIRSRSVRKRGGNEPSTPVGAGIGVKDAGKASEEGKTVTFERSMDEPELGAGIEAPPDHEPVVTRASPVDAMETEGESLTKGRSMRGSTRRRRGGKTKSSKSLRKRGGGDPNHRTFKEERAARRERIVEESLHEEGDDGEYVSEEEKEEGNGKKSMKNVRETEEDVENKRKREEEKKELEEMDRQVKSKILIRPPELIDLDRQELLERTFLFRVGRMKHPIVATSEIWMRRVEALKAYMQRYNENDDEEKKARLEEMERWANQMIAKKGTFDLDIDNLEKNEGIFQDRLPHLARLFRSVFTQRMLVEDPEMKRYFENEKILRICSVPLQRVAKRPIIWYQQPDLSDLEVGEARFDIAMEGQSGEMFMMKVDIKNIAFESHPLFIAQNALGAKLESLCIQFAKRAKRDMIRYYQEKIDNLIKAYQDLKEGRLDLDGSITGEEKFLRMRQLRQELGKTRQRRDIDMGKDVQLSRACLQMWKELKGLQKQQGFISTPVRCKFKRIRIKNVEEVDMREQLDIEQQLDEMEDDVESGFVLAQKTFEAARMAHPTSPPESPIRPVFDRRKAKESLIRSRLLNRGRQMTDDIVEPVLHKVQITNPSELTGTPFRIQEAARRREIEKKSYHVRVVVNEQVLGRTASHALDVLFNLQIAEAVKVRLHKWPESVKVELWESGILDSHIATLYVSVPGVEGSGHGPEAADSMQFSSPIAYPSLVQNTAGGSSEEDSGRSISGYMKLKLSWVGEDDRPAKAPPRSMSAQRSVAESVVQRNFASVQQLKEWMQSGEIDPNDPRNIRVLNLLSGVDDTLLAEGFSLISPGDEVVFQDEISVEQNPRIRYLRERGDTGLDYKVPLVIDEIDEDALKEKIKEDMESRRMTEFVRGVREHFIARKSARSHTARLTDLVRESRLPSWETVRGWIVDTFSIRHRLRPRRKDREAVVAVTDFARIIVQIGRGYCFPLRKKSEAELRREAIALGREARMRRIARAKQRGETGRGRDSDAEGDSEDDDDYEDPHMLHPFVEVVFRGQRKRTVTSAGTYPLFNESLSLDFEIPGHKLEPKVLRMVREDVHINLYDEVTIEMDKDDRRENVIYERRERRWLGSFRIPFSTIYGNRKVEGTFRMNVPVVNLGYDPPEPEEGVDGIPDTRLSLYVVLEPPLELFEEEPEEPLSVEDDRVVEHARRWLQALKSKFPHRQYSVLENDVKGRSVLISRYIRSQAPPREVEDSAAKIARFVAMIPFLEDAMSFQDRADVWSTTQQFLKLRAGDWEEHATLLCNHLIHFGKEAYVVVGVGIPEGETCYVMTKEGESAFLLWNAATGESFSHDDPHVPLRSIGTIFNAENVWANVQDTDFPASMSFDFNDTKCWKPFFTTTFPAEDLESVQVPELVFDPTPALFRDELEERISTIVRLNIEKWRHHLYTTRWHYQASSRLSKLLPMLEKDRQGVPFSEIEHMEKLRQITTGYDVQGFPIHVPWTDEEAVIDAVFNTDIHTNAEPNVEFALGVYVHPFPNKVASVWLYLAAMVNNM